MNLKPRIKAIVFDVGGVLKIPRFYINKSKKEFSGIHKKIADKLHIDIDEWFDAIYTLYNQAVVGEISRKKFIETASYRLKISKSKLVRTVKNCYNRFMYKNLFLYNLINNLRKKYIIGVLSDQWHLSREILIPKSENKNFDFLIISYEVKMRKPDKEIYGLLMKKINAINKKIKPNEVLFIDNREYNLLPAKKIGINTILFKNNKQLQKELRKYGIIIYELVK